jgi:hypothetical protein
MVQMILARRAAGDAADEGEVSAVKEEFSVVGCGLLDFIIFLDLSLLVIPNEARDIGSRLHHGIPGITNRNQDPSLRSG